MYYILLTAQQTATQAANTAQEVATQTPSNDIMSTLGNSIENKQEKVDFQK